MSAPLRLGQLIQPNSFADPSAPVPITLKITDIRPYENNPRRVTHPQYALLKASIRTQGLTVPLPVTQRPGADDYIVSAGGNTRLIILGELYRETCEERFYWIRCLLRPWISESGTLLAHLTENDCRGDLLFIERAHAIRELKQLLEQETARKLSLRQFSDLLKGRGYPLDPSLISRMEYALDVLWPAIPQALLAGMGRRTLLAIRQLHLAAERLWKTHAIEDDFSSVFQDLLRRYDGENWDLNSMRAAVQHEIAFRMESACGTVGLMLDDALDAVRGERAGASEPRSTSTPGSLPAAQQSAPVVILGLAEPALLSRKQAAPGRRKFSATRLHTLRRHAFGLASQLAERNHLSVVQACSTGCGFIVTDTPAFPTDPRQREALSALWWQLVACAQMMTAPVEIVLPLLPPESRLAQVLSATDQRLAKLAQAGVVMDPGQCGAILCARTSDADWQDLTRLKAVHRRLCQVADALGVTLWG